MEGYKTTTAYYFTNGRDEWQGYESYDIAEYFAEKERKLHPDKEYRIIKVTTIEEMVGVI